MPRVKIDYVVSFSNEDPENQASNLLSWEVGKKKWLCSKGEPSCSVVLQLARAVKISSVQIGAHHAALVEVLVGRSETPNEPFQVLVPSCVFASPVESRGGGGGGAGAERVRSFSGGALSAAAAHRWDRVRLVCSQPYNKHCKYGISFIHIFEPDGEPGPAAPTPALTLDTFSSDDEEFRPGELFAKHRQSGSAGDTGAQIRQATSQALKNNPDAAIKLVKTPLAKNKPTTSSNHSEPRDRQRDKDDLVYTKDDERPHAKIDHIVQRHKDEKSKDEAKTPKPKEKVDKTPRSKREEPSSSRNSESKRDSKVDSRRERDDKKQTDNNRASSSSKKDENRKRLHSDTNHTENGGAGAGAGTGTETEAGPECERPLRGVVFVLSGYQNPRRARLRDLALSLGAAHAREWSPTCTHLICAFSKTPKLQAVRAGPGGARVPAPTADWLEECGRRRRLLPWRWFAAEPALRLREPTALAPAPAVDDHDDDDDECDTDDEIEKVRRQRKKARTSPSRSPRTERDDVGDEVEFAKDERMQGDVTVESESDGADTDVEQAAPAQGAVDTGRAALPAMFAGHTFVLDPALAAPFDVRLLARYCIAYGGLVLTPSEVEEDSVSEDYYVLCGSQGQGRGRGQGQGRGRGQGQALARARRVRAHWLWASHARAARAPLHRYLLTE